MCRIVNGPQVLRLLAVVLQVNYDLLGLFYSCAHVLRSLILPPGRFCSILNDYSHDILRVFPICQHNILSRLVVLKISKLSRLCGYNIIEFGMKYLNWLRNTYLT